jgi:hypothetical protein
VTGRARRRKRKSEFKILLTARKLLMNELSVKITKSIMIPIARNKLLTIANVQKIVPKRSVSKRSMYRNMKK